MLLEFVLRAVLQGKALYAFNQSWHYLLPKLFHEKGRGSDVLENEWEHLSELNVLRLQSSLPHGPLVGHTAVSFPSEYLRQPEDPEWEWNDAFLFSGSSLPQLWKLSCLHLFFSFSFVPRELHSRTLLLGLTFESKTNKTKHNKTRKSPSLIRVILLIKTNR